jgi:hypothetical protein
MPKILSEEQIGEGLLTREPGLFPPADRKVIEEVGEEVVKKLTLYRYPISLSKFAKFIGALKSTPYDDLMHIGVVINDKYLTEKDAVLTFKRSGVPKESTSTLDVPVGLKELTINEMINRTRDRMGPVAFSTYCALNKGNCSNCQGYLKNMLDANGLSTSETTKFILQDLEQVTKNLPSYANAIANFFTGAKAVANRLIKGEGHMDDCQCGEGYLDFLLTDEQKAKNKKKLQDYTIEYLTRQGDTAALEAYKRQEGRGNDIHNFQLHRAKCKF